DDVEGLERAPGEARLERPEVAVLEEPFLELGTADRIEAVASVRAGVRPVTDVHADLEATGRAEALLRDELGPEPHTGAAAEVRRRRADGDTHLHEAREAEALLHAGEPHLAVERDGADALRVEPRDVVRVSRRPDVVRRIAAHQ